MDDIPRLALAHLPTPLQPVRGLEDLFRGLHVRVKRDDLTGSHLSGNKIRKLEYLLADALERGATHVLTCGGVQSNHCRATALACGPLGLFPELLLRTETGHPSEVPDPPTANVLLDRLAGARVHTCSPQGYRDRDVLLADLAQSVERVGGLPYIVPEGGSNALGALGYVRCAQELAAQCPDDPPTSIIAATGSGGTVAGLAIGARLLGLDARVIGVAVCDDEAYFRAIVHRISEEASSAYGLPRLEDDDFEILDGFQGPGYGLTTDEGIDLIRDTTRRAGLVLDHVYTGKGFQALAALAKDEPERLGSRPVFIHTGGIFGLYAVADQLAPRL